mmetsp:Transcript_36212/g.41764  ORF Transcript_36212/g.41764 Transcript_36212/m.41764 type:complete len:99 (-) Transcript_36212:212-508(-)
MVTVLVFSQNPEDGVASLKIYSVVVIQAVYSIVMIVIRPFKNVETNLVLVLNEFYFLVYSSVIVYYNEQSRWNGAMESIVIYTIVSNSLTTAVILLTC